jgi:hypothetical protein
VVVRVEGRRVPGGADRSRTRMVSGPIADFDGEVPFAVSKPASVMVKAKVLGSTPMTLRPSLVVTPNRAEPCVTSAPSGSARLQETKPARGMYDASRFGSQSGNPCNLGRPRAAVVSLRPDPMRSEPMQRISIARHVSQVFLWVVPLLPIPMLAYRPGGLRLYTIAWAAQVLLMAVAVWILSGESIQHSTADRRSLLLPGVFLIACWASATLGANMGPPPGPAVWAVTRTDQHVRYVALLLAGLLAWAGFGSLTARLREAGERLFSVLGLSAATISTALFTLFTLAALTLYDRAAQETASGNAPGWWPPLREFVFSWLVLFAVLTYLATSLYAIALGNVGLLGKFGRALFVVLGVIAAALALIAVTELNEPATLVHGPFVFIIPAVPFILPYLIGVNLVRRSGDPVS